MIENNFIAPKNRKNNLTTECQTLNIIAYTLGQCQVALVYITHIFYK